MPGHSIGPEEFNNFARCLVTAILTKFEGVVFECDDCDWVAVTLRSLFENQSDNSYDTYVYPAANDYTG